MTQMSGIMFWSFTTYIQFPILYVRIFNNNYVDTLIIQMHFRSIIPRSLSSTFQAGTGLIQSQSSDSVVDLSFRPSLRSDLMCHQVR